MVVYTLKEEVPLGSRVLYFPFVAHSDISERQPTAKRYRSLTALGVVNVLWIVKATLARLGVCIASGRELALTPHSNRSTFHHSKKETAGSIGKDRHILIHVITQQDGDMALVWRGQSPD